MEKSKETYENIVIPEELAGKVQEAIDISRKKRVKRLTRSRRKRVYQWAAGIAAAFTVVTTVGLNTNEAFAMEAQKLPVIGELARILTVRSYEKANDDLHISAKIPGVDLGGDGRALRYGFPGDGWAPDSIFRQRVCRRFHKSSGHCPPERKRWSDGIRSESRHI